MKHKIDEKFPRVNLNIQIKNIQKPLFIDNEFETNTNIIEKINKENKKNLNCFQT